jgi:hypothetical protein
LIAFDAIDDNVPEQSLQLRSTLEVPTTISLSSTVNRCSRAPLDAGAQTFPGLNYGADYASTFDKQPSLRAA